jgi:hypothetical protein
MIGRYVALSLISLTLLTAGILALAAPAPLRGPLLLPLPAEMPLAASNNLLALSLLQQPIFLADLLGLSLLAMSVLVTWGLALTWEALRRRQVEGPRQPLPSRRRRP